MKIATEQIATGAKDEQQLVVPLKAGTYTVKWAVVTADTHRVNEVSTIARAYSDRGVPHSVETVGNPAIGLLYERRLVLLARPDGHVG